MPAVYPEPRAERDARAPPTRGRAPTRGWRQAIDDLFLPDDARLDDRTRARVSARAERDWSTGSTADLRRHAARLLADAR